MMKQLVVSISYLYFVLPKESDISQAIEIIGHLMPVERTNYGEELIYSPDKGVSISFDLVDDECIRLPTPEEKENKKIEGLESSLSYKKTQLEEKEKRIKELECMVQQLENDLEEA